MTRLTHDAFASELCPDDESEYGSLFSGDHPVLSPVDHVPPMAMLIEDNLREEHLGILHDQFSSYVLL